MIPPGVQGWPAPLSDVQYEWINWSLRGLENLQGPSRKRPIRPPISIQTLTALKVTLNLDHP
jgi:hypothetical protein